jgi:hypothetical protein
MVTLVGMQKAKNKKKEYETDKTHTFGETCKENKEERKK